jgi:hypothetical protein
VTSQTASTSNGVNSVKLNANSGQSSGAITFSSEARVVNTGGKLTYLPSTRELSIYFFRQCKL